MIFVNVIKTNCFQLVGYKPSNKQIRLTCISLQKNPISEVSYIMDTDISTMKIETPFIFSTYSTFCDFSSWSASRYSS